MEQQTDTNMIEQCINMEDTTTDNELTSTQYRLLTVLVDADSAALSITAKCKLAGVSRNTYYDVIKLPQFVTKLKNIASDNINAHINDIVQASIHCAKNDKYKGHADRKMLLEMSGMYHAEPTVAVALVAQLPSMPQDDLDAMIRQYILDHMQDA